MDTSIALSYKPVQLDIEGAMQFRENKKRLESQNALAASQMANQQDELNNALNARQYAGSSDLSDPKNAMGLLRFGKQGADMYQSLLAGQASSASARKSQIEAAGSKTAHYRQILPLVNNPQDAMKWLEMIHGDPDMQDSPVARMPLDVAMSRIPQDPAGFQQWKQQAALGIDEYIKANAPKFTQVDSGGSVYTQQIPGLGGPATEVPGSRVTKTLSPAERAKLDAETETGNYSEESRNLMAALVAQGFSLPIPLGRGSKSDALKNDVYERAGRISQGLSPTGKPAPTPASKPGSAPAVAPAAEPAASAVDVAANIGNARQDQQSRAASLRYYTSGRGNQIITSLNTAVDHLDTLSDLATALGNGDVGTFNRIGQAYKKEFGQDAPTNLDAAKVIIAREVLKAITASGGSVMEADELQSTMDKVRSPQQLAGVVDTLQKLLAGQLESVGTQYKITTNRTNFEERLSDRTKRVLGRGKDAGGGDATIKALLDKYKD